MWFALLLLALGITACDQPASSPSAVPGEMASTGSLVLKVQDHEVTEDMLNAYTQNIPEKQLQQMKDRGQFGMFLEQIATGEVLYHRAIEGKLHEDSEVQVMIAAATRQIMAQQQIQTIAEAAVSDEKVQAWYDDHKVQFVSSELKARQIILDAADTELAQQLVDQLAGTAEDKQDALFAELATKHSSDAASAANGGDLGWFSKTSMLPEVAEATFAAEGGEILGPISSRFGLHVVQVTDRRDATPLEDARPRIEEELKQEAVKGYLDELKNALNIEWGPGYEPKTPSMPMMPPMGG
jgi:peptidyl-prolyl cis-trans isomerase C